MLAALVVALFCVGSLQAATTLADPILGTWKVTKGGSGTFSVADRAGVLALTARGTVTLGCVKEADGILGFADLPSDTKLPAGRYNANFGVSGQGCYYNVALTLARGVLTGRVVLSENDEPGGPFAFAKVGNSTYRWTVKTKALNGRGTVTTDPKGRVTAASGTLATSRWKLSLKAPAKLAFAAEGKFSLTLAATVTSGTCSDKRGTLVLSDARARLLSVCGRTTAGDGTVRLDS
jgi:hypothetical protein